MLKSMGIEIAGVGAYVPERILTNQELSLTVDTSDEWITNKTGIRERRVCAPEEAPSDLGCRAAAHCLQQAGVAGSAVDLIVVACATPDQSQPAVACMIQQKLGIAETLCPAFDVSSVCSGFVFALNVAQSMMLADPEQYEHALVIGTDAFTKILDYKDRRTCIFFGDGAGAVLLSRTESGRRMRFRMGSDGRGSRAIEVRAGGTRMPVTREVLDERLNTFAMDGQRVWNFALETVPKTIETLLEREGLRPTDIDLLILHQSNLRMIEAITRAVGLPIDRTFTSIAEYGNTAAASIPITLQRACAAGRLRPGSRVVLCGFGGGLSWGAALLEW